MIAPLRLGKWRIFYIRDKMALIELIDANKNYDEKIILKNANFSANLGDKIAIIGKNGVGKSSLMKILAQKSFLDSGRLNVQNNIKISMLSQEPDFSSSLSVMQSIKQSLSDIYEALENFKLCNEKLANEPDNKELLKQIDTITRYLEAKDAWDIDAKIERALKELKLFEYKDRIISSLSGGEIRRIALCRVILENADIMLLDEPSNHLDVYMTSFLEDMLKMSKSCVIFISHDRYFIDQVADTCLEIDEGELRIFKGNYTNYLSKKAQLLESLNKSYETLVKTLKAEEEWLRRGVKARLKRNEGRKERVLKMREEAKKNPGQIKKLKLELDRASKSFNQEKSINRQKMLFELKNATKSVGQGNDTKELFKDFSTRILQNERIGIVGANGCGKSTFIKILLKLQELDSGTLNQADINIGYFDQARTLLQKDKSILEIFCPNGGDSVEVKGKTMHVYAYLKNFLFPKEFLQKSVAVLSGGEKNRLALALLFTQKYDVLVLDEPTNDLDIATINILEEYLLGFEGAILLISHDRFFLDKIATKLYAFENSRIEIYHKPYTQYLEDEREKKDFEQFTRNLEDLKEEHKEKQKQKSAKLSYKEKEILEKYPEKIATLEAAIKKLNENLSDEKIYKEIGLEKLYTDLEQAQSELARLEEAYFEVLEKSENEL